MRDLRKFDHLRDVSNELRLYGVIGGATEGVFRIDEALVAIASAGGGWDHVSVSHSKRTPTWEEMERVKRMFFNDNETAMQLHVPIAEHISGRTGGSGRAPHTLHLWRPIDERIPMPPSWMVDDDRLLDQRKVQSTSP